MIRFLEKVGRFNKQRERGGQVRCFYGKTDYTVFAIPPLDCFNGMCWLSDFPMLKKVFGPALDKLSEEVVKITGEAWRFKDWLVGWATMFDVQVYVWFCRKQDNDGRTIVVLQDDYVKYGWGGHIGGEVICKVALPECPQRDPEYDEWRETAKAWYNRLANPFTCL